MLRTRSWYRFTARWLALAMLSTIPVGLLLLADPALANTVTITVATGVTTGPTGTFQEVRANAACGLSGGTQQLVSGGGVSLTFSTNSIHVNGSAPWDGSSEITSTVTGTVATNSSHWLGVGGSGGMSDPTAKDTALAMCFTPGSGAGTTDVTSTDIVMNFAAGPVGANNVSVTVATCPVGDRLLSGGARITNTVIGNDKLAGSFPTYATSTSHAAAPEGSVNPDSWAAVGMNGGATHTSADTPGTFAYAVCARGGAGHVTTTVRFNEKPGPTVGSTGQSVTTTCKSGDGTLAGGGAAIDNGGITITAFAVPASTGDHLTGDFPSDAAGKVVAGGTINPPDWTATTHTGGMASNGTVSDAWAMCVNST